MQPSIPVRTRSLRPVKTWDDLRKQGIQDPEICIAAERGDIDEVRRLLDAQGPGIIDRANDLGSTALIAAAYHNRRELAELLIARGANVNHADNKGYTALHVAARYGRTEIARMLLNNNRTTLELDGRVNDESTWYRGFTPLMFAAFHGCTEIVELLLPANPHLEFEDSEIGEQTALLLAAGEGHAEIVQLLLDARANIHAVNMKNMTALMRATKKNHTAVVEVLLAAGAHLFVQNTDGMTAPLIAISKGHHNIARLLREAELERRQLADNEREVAATDAQDQAQSFGIGATTEAKHEIPNDAIDRALDGDAVDGVVNEAENKTKKVADAAAVKPGTKHATTRELSKKERHGDDKIERNKFI